MRKTSFMVLVALAVFAASACSNNPTSPSANPRELVRTESTGSGTTTTTIKDGDLVGTWQAVKAEGRNYSDQTIRRDLVAEGGKVTLAFDPDNYCTVTLTMPGETPRVNIYTWYTHESWGRPQVDFWPTWIPKKDLEYGDGHGFYITLSGNTLTLSEGGGSLLGFDFGWHDAWGNDWAILELVLTR